MKLWRIEFKVRPRGMLFAFPMDMLRYDSCMPASEGDSGLIMDTFSREKGAVGIKRGQLVSVSKKEAADMQITMVSYSHGDKKWEPSLDRWMSFGWETVAYSLMVREV